MQSSVVYVDDADYVIGTISGDSKETELGIVRGEMNSKLLAHNCKRLLVDARGISKLQSVFDDYDFTTQHRTELPLGTRHAVVIRPEHEKHMQFVEDVAQNRSINLKLFMDKNQAINWLCND